MLSKIEERELLQRYHDTKDETIRWRLVLENLGFIHHVVKFYSKRCYNLEFEDLVDVGIIELYRAIERYDMSQHVRLVSFCGISIRHRIKSATIQERIIRTPLSITNPELKQQAKKVMCVGELTEISKEEEDIEDFSEYVPKLRSSIEKLPEREQRILQERLEGKTLKELSDMFNLSRERIRQIWDETIAKLRKELRCT